jgi:MFS family permease
MLGDYRAIFGNLSFSRFWLGFTFSALGDAITRVALTWYVYEQTHSPVALGLLMLCYTGPVVVGGLLAGTLLDRYDRRRVMVADNLIRGTAVGLLPLLSAFGQLALWHIYAVAAVYGLLMMISLAGGPALIPSIVRREQLHTANALETLSFTLAGVIGPVIAGVLIVPFGAPNVVLLDAISYVAFAGALSGIRPALGPEPFARGEGQTLRLRDAVRLLFVNRVLLSTTFMFMAFNIGSGFVSLWLPIFTAEVLNGGAGLYGILLAASALGEVVGAMIAGGQVFRLSLGTLICLAQILSGAAIGLVFIGPSLWTTIPALVLLGLFSAPMTIWAQALRMQIIPEQLRGRTFALLRTLMQSGTPLGGASAGLLLPVLGLPVMIGFSALLTGFPGFLGYQVSALREGESYS